MRLGCFVVTLCVGLAPLGVRAADDPDVEIARRHYRRGAELYEAQRYEEAIVELEAARSARPVPELDYNIARCYDRLEKVELAIEHYERFLGSHPPDEAEVRARLTILRERLRVRSVRPWRTRYPVLVPALVAGVAGVTLASGAALYAVSGSRYDGLVGSGCIGDGSCGRMGLGETHAMEQAGLGLLIAGGVLVAVDVGLWAAWRHR